MHESLLALQSGEEVWRAIYHYGMPAVQVLLILWVAYLLAGWISRLIQSACRKARVEETLEKFFGKLVRWTILVFAIVCSLERFGIRTTSFAVVLGTVGIAIGLAFQGTLSNFASGLMLLIFRPYKVGDMIVVGGQTGKVAEIDLFCTMIDTRENRRIIIPNGSIFGNTIENATFNQLRRLRIPVGVEYAADIDKTRAVLTAAAESVTGREADQPIEVELKGLGASSVDWEIILWCQTSQHRAVQQETIRAIKYSLDRAGIRIPFPQMDVHLDPPLTMTRQ